MLKSMTNLARKVGAIALGVVAALGVYDAAAGLVDAARGHTDDLSVSAAVVLSLFVLVVACVIGLAAWRLWPRRERSRLQPSLGFFAIASLAVSAMFSAFTGFPWFFVVVLATMFVLALVVSRKGRTKSLP
jgi:peptidoglycan/LPS O-acetylase OafA/YrhL